MLKKCQPPGYFALAVLCFLIVSGCTNTGPAGTVPGTPAPTPEIVYVTVVVTPTPLSASPATTTPMPEPAVTPVNTLHQISDSVLKSRIQNAKNKLNMYKDTDMAETVVIKTTDCEIKKSKELGYLIDTNTGEMTFVKGDYGSILFDSSQQNMVRGHSYIILHSHARYWVACTGEVISNFDTFSLTDLAVGNSLTEQGYHLQKIIAVGDRVYEVYPETSDGWKTPEEIFRSVDLIEQRREMSFHTVYEGTKYYDVDNIMPILTNELGYVYTVDNTVVVH
jgi:hypothetical protein